MIAKPSPGLSPLVSANTDLSICENPHACAKRQLRAGCRHCVRQRVNAANKNKRLSIGRFAFERMNWSRSFAPRQNSFLRLRRMRPRPRRSRDNSAMGNLGRYFTQRAERAMKFHRVNFCSDKCGNREGTYSPR
jgi:hypothetical protein